MPTLPQIAWNYAFRFSHFLVTEYCPIRMSFRIPSVETFAMINIQNGGLCNAYIFLHLIAKKVDFLCIWILYTHQTASDTYIKGESYSRFSDGDIFNIVFAIAISFLFEVDIRYLMVRKSIFCVFGFFLWVK